MVDDRQGALRHRLSGRQVVIADDDIDASLSDGEEVNNPVEASEVKTAWYPLFKELVHGLHPLQQQQHASKESGRLVFKLFLSLSVLLVLFDLVLVVAEDSVSSALTLSVLFIAALAILCHVIAIVHFPQNRFAIDQFETCCVIFSQIFPTLF